MGIDISQAEQLASKCSWYVYQFHKSLESDPERKHQIIALEKQKSRTQKSKLSKLPGIKDNTEESTTTLTSLDKDDSCSSTSLPRVQNKHSVLPAIHNSDSFHNSRLRRVDFHSMKLNATAQNSTRLQQQSSFTKVQTLLKLPPIVQEPPAAEQSTPIDLEASRQKAINRTRLFAGQLRSILRKQNMSSTSAASTEASQQKTRSRVLTPSSSVLDDIPLGTKSQRLFGGSECFAEIMNELEQQRNYI